MAFNWNKFPWTNLHDLNLDWIIQTVKQLENRVAELGDKVAELAVTVQLYTTKVATLIQEAITNTLTGSGDLNIQKTGDVRISGNSVQLSRTIISDDAEQLTLRNTSDNTSLTATFRNGILSLIQNHSSGGVQVFPIMVPNDEDIGLYAANCGYVNGEIIKVNDSITAETSARTAGDNALQSTIDNVIMPLLNARGIRDFHVTGTVGQDRGLTSVTFDSENPKTELDELLTGSTKVRLVVETPDETRYFNMCYKSTTDYGFSGLYKSNDNTAYHQLIVYNGTAFAIH